MQTLLLRVALLHLHEYLLVITYKIVGFAGCLRIHQVHVGLGHIAFEGHKRLVVAAHLHQYLRLLSRTDDDVAESQSIGANPHLARQPQGNLHLQRAIVGKAESPVKAFPRAYRCEAAHKEFHIHPLLVAQQLHLDGGNALVDFSCRQRLVLRILHVLPLGRNLHLLLRLRVADVEEAEGTVEVALREVHLLRVQRHGLEVERQMGHTALRHPEQRVGLQVSLFLVGLCATRKGILLAVGRLHKRLLGKANPAARVVNSRDVQHRLRLLQLHLSDEERGVTCSHECRGLLPHNLFSLGLPHQCNEGKQNS